jgi:chemotaxis signal transduction protein
MKFATFETHKTRPRSGPSEQIILFSVSNQTFAIAASAVQEIRSTDSLPGTAHEIDCPGVPKVRHTIDRARQTYYVVNAGRHFSLPVSRPALVLILRQFRVALLVDRIDRMTDISRTYPLPHIFAGDEQRWYRGLTYIDDHVIPVVQPAGFLTSQDFQRLEEVAHSTPQREFEGVRA